MKNGRLVIDGEFACTWKDCTREFTSIQARTLHITRAHEKRGGNLSGVQKKEVAKPKPKGKKRGKYNKKPKLKEVSVPVMVNFCFNCGARQPNAHISGGMA